MIEGRPLLVLDSFLENTNRLRPFDLNWKDVAGIVSEHQTVKLEQFGDQARMGD